MIKQGLTRAQPLSASIDNAHNYASIVQGEYNIRRRSPQALKTQYFLS